MSTGYLREKSIFKNYNFLFCLGFFFKHELTNTLVNIETNS